MSGTWETKLGSDPGLDQVRDMVARILEFVVADGTRLEPFLKLTSFRPEAIRETASSPLFMLSVLDSVTKDDWLMDTLAEREGITPVIVELARARLAFHVVAEMTPPGAEETPEASARVQRQLRILLHMMRR